jgi:hypothetical protein
MPRAADGGATAVAPPSAAFRPRLLAVVVAVLVASEGVWSAVDFFGNWGPTYEVAEARDIDTVTEARFLDSRTDPSGEQVFAGSAFRGHPIIAQLAPRVYGRLRWVDGRRAMVYPGATDRPVTYVFSARTAPEEPERFFPAGTQIEAGRFERPPAGKSAAELTYVAYRLTPAQVRAQIDRYLGDPAFAPLHVTLGGQIEAVAAAAPQRVVAGETLPLRVIWRVVDRATAEYLTMYVHLIDGESRAWAETNATGFSSAEWRAGDLVISEYRLAVPRDVPPGQYRVEVGVFDQFTLARLPVTAGGGAAQLPPLRVVAPPAAGGVVADGAGRPVAGGQFAREIRLVGYETERREPGRLGVQLYWQAAAPPDRDYTVFVQVLDAAGKLVAQADGMPANGRLPTSSWEVNEVVADAHAIALPAGLAPGRYRLIAGMYVLANGERLPLEGGGDYVALAEIPLP